MGIAALLTKPVTGLIGKVLDKFVRDKVSEADLAKLKMEAGAMAAEELQKQENSFRGFVLEYEGRAKDLPHWLLAFRGSVRPVLTYSLFGLWAWSHIYLFLHIDMNAETLVVLREQQLLLFKLNLLSLGFWFGEKLLTRSGLGEMFNKKGK